MDENKKSISLKQKIDAYMQVSRIEGGFIASVFFLLGIWYSTENFPIYKSIMGLISINLIVNSGSIINYAYDKKIDTIAKKNTDFFENISIKEMHFVSVILSLIGIGILFTFNFSSLILGLILFDVFFIYAIPPLRLKTFPPLDSIINGLGFGSIPFLIGWSIIEKIPHRIIPFYGSLICGIIVISYYLLISSFDIESDKKAGIQTSCTILGFNKTIIAGVFIFLFALLLSFYSYPYFILVIISLIICLPIMILMLFKKDIVFIQKAVSSVYLLWASSTLLILFYFSKSIIPGLLVALLLILIIQVFVIYLKKENVR